ncbi:MAG: NOP5/NOP56 family protein [Candidatus Diapherotrites archaeon]
MDGLEALRKKLLKKAKEQVREEYTKRDVHIIKAVNLLDDLDSTFNLLAEQIREWYSFHFPELAEIVKDNERYLRLIYEIGGRFEFGSVGHKKIGEFYDNEEGVRQVAEKAKASIGSDIDKLDLDEIKLLALNALNIREERKCLDRYVESAMSKEMPNFSALAGGVLGARLLSKAGSMKKLALMPASTIQVLGAEKALFMHLHKGARGPKYGLLYAHPMLKAAKPWNKGKMARTLSGKLAIAARRDYFIKNESPQLKETEKGLEDRAKELDSRKPKRRAYRAQGIAGGKEMLPEQEGGNESRGRDDGGGWRPRPRIEGRGGTGRKGKPTRYEPRGQHRGGGNYGRPRQGGFGWRGRNKRPDGSAAPRGFGGQERGGKPEGHTAPREFGEQNRGAGHGAGGYARGRHGGIAMRGGHSAQRGFGGQGKPHSGGERHGTPDKKVLHKKEGEKGRRLH